MSAVAVQAPKSFISASIAWQNINVFSKPESHLFSPNKPATQIIKNVSGEVPCGTTLAIMGSSGAGKTTLLNVLTARNLANFQVDGCVKINGQLADVNTITKMSAYVQQQDLFLPTLTVREHLVFQALVRMDKSMSDEQKVQRINEVMKELSLEKCADTIVGGTLATGKGISGGELKRLSFAVEILTNPSIMFCDEPTSGLDSFMAANLVTYLNKMATAGRTIICTIHQPSSETFMLFKKLLLLADGRVAYMGDLQEALPFFNLIGLKCPPNYNPADHYIRELAVLPGQEVQCKKKVNRICDYFEKLRENPRDRIDLNRQMTYVQNQVYLSSYKVSCFLQYQALAWRSYLITLREPLLTYVRVGQAIIIALMLGIFYFNQKYDQRGMLNMNGSLFLYLINLSVQNAFAVVNVFCSELPVFLREHTSGMYRVDAYFICKNLAEFPVFVFIPIFAASITYFMIGYYPTADAFLYMVVVGIFISLVGVSYGYCISCLCNNTDLALSMGPPILIPLQLLGGYYLNSKTIPVWLVWAEYISWFQYGFDLLMQNQWSNVAYLDCPSIIDENNSTTMTLATATTTTVTNIHGYEVLINEDYSENNGTNNREIVVGSMCIGSGQEVVKFMGLGNRNQFVDFAAIAGVFLFLRTTAYIALYIRAKNSR